eukprot:4137699-Amphidinium_carterae.1
MKLCLDVPHRAAFQRWSTSPTSMQHAMKMPVNRIILRLDCSKQRFSSADVWCRSSTDSNSLAICAKQKLVYTWMGRAKSSKSCVDAYAEAHPPHACPVHVSSLLLAMSCCIRFADHPSSFAGHDVQPTSLMRDYGMHRESACGPTRCFRQLAVIDHQYGVTSQRWQHAQNLHVSTFHTFRVLAGFCKTHPRAFWCAPHRGCTRALSWVVDNT